MLREVPAFTEPVAHEQLMMATTEDMSGQPVMNDVLDDIFGSAPASPVAAEHDASAGSVSEVHRPAASDPSDIPRLRSTHVTNGYREGIADSKGKFVQEGFDEGYSLGAEFGLQAGWCLGVLEGIWQALQADAKHKAVENASPLQQNAVTEVGQLQDEARQALQMEKLLSPLYFGEDGIWTYEVNEQDTQHSETTFRQVAAAHPLIASWMAKVRAVGQQFGIDLK